MPNAKVVYDYINSWHGNVKELLKDREEEFLDFLKKRISEEEPLFVHKSTGAFKGFKRRAFV